RRREDEVPVLRESERGGEDDERDEDAGGAHQRVALGAGVAVRAGAGVDVLPDLICRIAFITCESCRMFSKNSTALPGMTMGSAGPLSSPPRFTSCTLPLDESPDALSEYTSLRRYTSPSMRSLPK